MRFQDNAALSKAELEEGRILAPRFDENGLIPVITTDAKTGKVLMLAHMNAEALHMTIKTGQAVYYSRSRKEIWHKGKTSGQIQVVKQMRIDCDQDAILLSVMPGGDGGCCHVGYKNCFYRVIPFGDAEKAAHPSLQKPDVEKLR